MSSIIFGGIYLGHKGIINHRREKQRQKNYERWEGLRDEYDEQRKITRESRSLDIQRTGSDYARDGETDNPIVTLRDQQEANDARTSWRPQETFDGPGLSAGNRRASVEVTQGSGLRPIGKHKTGSTWDEDLPQPLRVSRRTWDEYQPSGLRQSGSLQDESVPDSPRGRSSSRTPPANNKPSPRPEITAPSSIPHPTASRSVSIPVEYEQTQYIEPIQHDTPGGRMAELIEFGDSHRPNPFSNSHTPPQSFGGFQNNLYGPAPVPTPAPAPAPALVQPSDGSMQEWWKQP